MDYSIFDSLVDSVIVIDDKKEIAYCNESAAKLLQSSQKRLIHRGPVYNFLTVDDANLVFMPEGKWGLNEPTPYTEVSYTLKNGTQGKIQLATQPFQDGGKPHWVIMVRDVTLEEMLHTKYKGELNQKEDAIKQLEFASRELEKYSKNLEKMVEERTAQVAQANRTLSAIMNSLGQGFLVFDKDGFCGSVFTKACEEILEVSPSGKTIWDVLRLSEHETKQFKMWMQAVFSEALPFESLRSLGPDKYAHSAGRHIVLDYFDIRGEAGRVTNLVVVATDRTVEYEASLALEKERAYVRMIIKLVENKKQFSQFIGSAKTMIQSLEEILGTARPSTFDHQHFFRLLHTLEGEAGAFSVYAVRTSSREAQEVLEPLKLGVVTDKAIIIDALKMKVRSLSITFDQFLYENRMLMKAMGIYAGKKVELFVEDIVKFTRELREKGVPDDICTRLQDQLLRQPVHEAFGHFNGVVEQVSHKLEKKVGEIQFIGGDLRINTEMLEPLISSLVHAFRNAVDHGIETPDERLMNGKADCGSIVFEAHRFLNLDGKMLHFIIRDDGRGIDPEIIREKLIEKNLVGDPRNLSDSDAIQFVFAAGFSSKDQIGDFSGRGVGLDAIRFEAERLGGKAWVESKLGQGTELHIQVPDEPFVLPLAATA